MIPGNLYQMRELLYASPKPMTAAHTKVKRNDYIIFLGFIKHSYFKDYNIVRFLYKNELRYFNFRTEISNIEYYFQESKDK